MTGLADAARILMTEEPVTIEQLQCIEALQAASGVSSEAIARYVLENFGCADLAQLDREAGYCVIDWLDEHTRATGVAR